MDLLTLESLLYHDLHFLINYIRINYKFCIIHMNYEAVYSSLS